MKLFVMDKPDGSRGRVLITGVDSRDAEHVLGSDWRPATRWERFWFEFTTPRLSIRGWLLGVATVVVLEAIFR